MSAAAVTESIIETSYVTSVRGLLCLGELICGVCVIICASVWSNGGFFEPAAGWTLFVSIFSLVITLVFFIANMFKVRQKLLDNVDWWPLAEGVAYLGMCLGYLSCGITAAVFGKRDPAIAATSAFSFFCTILYGVDLALLVKGTNVLSQLQSAAGSGSSSSSSRGQEPPNTAY